MDTLDHSTRRFAPSSALFGMRVALPPCAFAMGTDRSPDLACRAQVEPEQNQRQSVFPIKVSNFRAGVELLLAHFCPGVAEVAHPRSLQLRADNGDTASLYAWLAAAG